MKKLLISSALSLVSLGSYAACTCQCVNGQMQPICNNSMDMPPICPPTICPMTPPSVAPISPPAMPPLGTSQCSNEQVLNPYTRQYEWKRICR